MGSEKGAVPTGSLAAKPNETPEEKEARIAKMRKIVEGVPGATVFQEGMKVPGQEEREEKEEEWMRGEFDPVGDLAVTGMRLERGEGRSADWASGPTCGKHDDLLITIRGSPVEGEHEPFFAPRGAEAMLAGRAESRWLVELSDPRLDEYWRASLAAMSKGDLCRFTCAAKKAQQWLQNLADCCLALGGEPDIGDEEAGGTRAAAERRVELLSARLQVQPGHTARAAGA